MSAIEISVSGANKVLLRLQRVRRGIPAEIDRVTEINAHRLVVLVQQQIRAQGLIETGAYLNSWSVLKVAKSSYAASTDAAQSNRLEFGFTGVDALGRNYRQSPRPHRRPAADLSRAMYMEDLRKVVPRLWGK